MFEIAQLMSSFVHFRPVPSLLYHMKFINKNITLSSGIIYLRYPRESILNREDSPALTGQNSLNCRVIKWRCFEGNDK